MVPNRVGSAAANKDSCLEGFPRHQRKVKVQTTGARLQPHGGQGQLCL